MVTTVTTKDSENTDLAKKLAAAEGEKAELAAKLAEAESEVTDLTQRLATNEIDRISLTDRLATNGTELTDLKAELKLANIDPATRETLKANLAAKETERKTSLDSLLPRRPRGRASQISLRQRR